MNKDPRYTTLIFINVKDSDKLLASLRQHLTYTFVKEKVQNDGIVIVVVAGMPSQGVEEFLGAFCQQFGFNDVQVRASKGNIFG